LAFSYCLPQSPSSQGFLSLSHDGTVRDDNRAAAHAPLVSQEGNPELASMYFIELVGMSLGDSLLIDGNQMLYYDDPAAAPFTLACLAFAALDTGDDGEAFSVIGSYTLASAGVVYDVAGGKVGFIPGSC
jgi:hypothetical protein